MPVKLRVDCGSETGIMATIHGSLMEKHHEEDENFNVADYVMYGRSTENKIERW